jgi:hypothetical protein
MKYNPEEDGLTHINIYSKAKTALGRMLSNFAFTPIVLKEGLFNSVESYWYFAQLELWCEDDSRPTTEELMDLRQRSGFFAKKYGKELCGKYFKGGAITIEQEKQFHSKILEALIAKAKQTPNLEGMIVASELPFTHYLVFGSVVKQLPQHNWQVKFWEELRRKLKQQNKFFSFDGTRIA